MGWVPCFSCSQDLKLGNLLGLFQKAGFLHTDTCVNTSGSKVKSVGRGAASWSLIVWGHPTQFIRVSGLTHLCFSFFTCKMEITREPTDCFLEVIYAFYFYWETFVGSQWPTGVHYILTNEKTMTFESRDLGESSLLTDFAESQTPEYWPRPYGLTATDSELHFLPSLIFYVLCPPGSLQLTAQNVRDMRNPVSLCVLFPPTEFPSYPLPVWL